MTTTYATDAQVATYAPIVLSALDALNATLGAKSYSTTTLDAMRVEAQRLILIDLRAKGIESADVTRSADLLRAEVCKTAHLLCSAVKQRSTQARGAGQPEVYAQEAEFWDAEYRREIERAAPVDGIRSTGASFTWDRG